MKKLGILAAVAAILLLGAGVYAMNDKKNDNNLNVQATPTEKSTVNEAAPPAAPEMNFESASLPKDPLGARTLGDPKAPVRIEEFASLTCGHCAHFEATTFPELKKKYIDTGKVFYTFTDFPLNAPALDAAMIARCLPPERYFPFIVLLFGSQEQWAFTQDYKIGLRQNAKLAGLSDEKYDACIADKTLKEGIAKTMQERGQAKGIDSTPGFLVNDKLMKGAMPMTAFDQAIEDALKEKKPAGTK